MKKDEPIRKFLNQRISTPSPKSAPPNIPLTTGKGETVVLLWKVM